MSDLITWLFAYVLIGALVWMLCEPQGYFDFALSRYCHHFGRLPPRGFVVLAVVAIIVLWPVMVMGIARGMVKALRGRA